MVDASILQARVVVARRRLRYALGAALTALAVTAGLLVGVGPAAESLVCLGYGPGPVNNGKAVIAAGVALGVGEDAIVAGLTAAMSETGLLNLANPNVPESLALPHDGLSLDQSSVGILGQTRSWGPVGELMTPSSAATKFFTAMRVEAAVGSQAMSPAQVAGRVQRSAMPERYTAQVTAARQFYRDHVGQVRATRCPAGGSVGVEEFS